MATVNLVRLVGKVGAGAPVRLVSLFGQSIGSDTVRLVSLFGRTTSQVPLVIDAGPDLVIEPMEYVTFSATSSEFVVWSIVQTSGPTQQLVNAGPFWEYRSPGTLTVVTLGWTITGTAATSGDLERAVVQNLLSSSSGAAVRVAFMGSSTTVGNNATVAANRYVNLFSAQIRAAKGAAGSTLALDSTPGPTTPGLHARNGGLGGTTAANYVPASRHAELVAFQPHVVFHMIGSNDYGFSVNPATYKANIETALNAIDAEIAGGVRHVLINAYQRTDATGSFPFAQYGLRMAEIAAARDNVTYVDLNPFYIAEGIPGADPLNLIDTDNLHQTNAGHQFMADRLFEQVVVPPSGATASDSVVHTIRAHGGFWSPGPGSTIQARGVTRHLELPV